MDIINRIEISYFRSLYKVDLKEVGELNVISGSNDAGKSNVLKALNLFFNGFTDWSQSIDFYSDINKSRLREVRSESIKGKQIIWIAITFDTPNSYS
ncbi:ATPase, partial [Halobacteriales archaeon SW_7_65_23]